MKAHADDGAWAERTTVMTTLMGRASELAGAFERRRCVAASGAHGYANWDDGSLAHGELVSDLAGLLVALGGPRPDPVVGLALTSVTGERCGAGGGTWGLVFAGLLAGHAQRLRAEHDLGFAECCEHYVAASIAAEEALGEVSADIRDITRDASRATRHRSVLGRLLSPPSVARFSPSSSPNATSGSRVKERQSMILFGATSRTSLTLGEAILAPK